MSEPTSDPSQPRKRIVRRKPPAPAWTNVAITFILCGAVLIGVKMCLDTTVDGPGRLAQGIGRAATETIGGAARVLGEFTNLKPEVTEETVVVRFEDSPIAELAIIEKEILVATTNEQKWLFSTKHYKVRGKYLIKAGFDLKKEFSIAIDPATGIVTARLPEPEILSATLVGDLELVAKDGLINKVNESDRAEVMRRFQGYLRQQARESGVLEAAREQALERLQELADRNGQDMRFRFGGPPPIPED